MVYQIRHFVGYRVVYGWDFCSWFMKYKILMIMCQTPCRNLAMRGLIPSGSGLEKYKEACPYVCSHGYHNTGSMLEACGIGLKKQYTHNWGVVNSFMWYIISVVATLHCLACEARGKEGASALTS